MKFHSLPLTMQMATRPASGPRQVSGKSVTTPTTAPLSSPARMAETAITCGYDYQGRRFEKKVTVNGTISSHCWYLYRGYLQVAELDLMHPEPLLVKSYLWDPTEPTATRVLMLTNWKNGGTTIDQHLCFMHDALKNVTSIFDDYQTRRARYEYAPFGRLIVAERNMAQESRFRFSCEYMDDELGLVYYNYRHLNPTDGRWINRDPIQEQGGWNLYAFIRNRINIEVDLLGKIPPYNGGASGIVEVPIFSSCTNTSCTNTSCTNTSARRMLNPNLLQACRGL